MATTTHPNRKRINLLFGIHCHQPVGNFDFVFEQVYQQSYLPFLKVLAQHPQIKMTLHYTGGLLVWLEERHPEWFTLLRSLVGSGQVELLSGGFYEPILAVIPEADRCGQISLLNTYLSNKFDARPQGIWLAERVWDSSIVPSLVKSGIKYVLVDDFHFICAGRDMHELYGHYLTEEEGYPLALFPIDTHLRYLTPFKAVEQTIEYLAEIADTGGSRCAIIMDDGEKYGSWPDTYAWVYQEGWLKQFFNALEANQDWIKTLTFSEAMQAFPARGRIYLPTAAYFEMGQWSLPSQKAVELGKIHRELESTDKLERIRPFLRGGIWKNFFVKYPESNRMHKKMLYLTQRIKKLPEGEERDAAQKHLYKAQTNDAYWHGVFGGLYLPHLRHAIYRNLIQGERCLDAAQRRRERQANTPADTRVRWETIDYDLDGFKELMVSTPFYTCGLSPHQGGQVFELSIKPLGFNLLNTLQRRFEHYHANEGEVATAPPESDAIETIHARETEADRALREELFYDWYPRQAFIDHFFAAQTTLKEFAQSHYAEQGNFTDQAYVVLSENGDRTDPHGQAHNKDFVLQRLGGVWDGEKHFPLELIKTYRFSEKGLKVNYCLANKSEARLLLRFGVECNLAMPACGGPGGQYRINGKSDERPASFNTWAEEEQINRVELSDEVLKGVVGLGWDRPATLWRFPLETVAQSEGGWEKTYQSSVLMPIWCLDLNPGEEWRVVIELNIDW